MLGTTINGLHIVEKLGEGGMAEVYRAVDLKLERDVAIKFLRATARDPEQQLKRFEIEAKALAKLRHPNIVTVLGYGEHEGQPYLVMEYVPGGTLKEMLGQPMEPRKAAKLLAPIARALHYAHEKNIIHRDVKPSNILITESGEPMLSDFGVAKMLGLEETMDLTGTSVGIGTPYYMSPEQGRNREIGPQSDVYSLGIVLYEMVTGRKPYEAETPLAVILKHIEDPLPNLAEQVRGLPKDIERTIYAALAKKPTERFKSMHEMAETLEQGIVGTAIRIRKPRSAANSKRYLWLGGAALGLLALVLVIQNLGQRAAAQDPPDEQVSGLDQASTLVAGATATQSAELQATQAANFTATAQILAITREWRETLRLTPSATRGPTNTPAPTSAVTGQSGGINLALNKAAQSNVPSCNSSETPDKAVNGSRSGGLSDKWCAHGTGQAFHWQVDLETTYAINKIVIYHAGAGGEGTEQNTQSFSILLSQDNVRWETVAEITGNTRSTTTHEFQSVDARYVRLAISRGAQDESTARIYEVQVYGIEVTSTSDGSANTILTATPSPLTRLGGLDLNSYCQANGWSSSETTNASSANSWQCTGGKPNESINMDLACQWQYRDSDAFARAQNASNAYSWACYAP